MKKRQLGFLLLLLIFALVVAACSSDDASTEENPNEGQNETGQEQEPSTEPKVLLLNNGREPTSLDPPIGFDAASYNLINNFMEGLTRLGADHTPEAGIAEDWDISEDGRVYTFYIRENANWSNGDPVTAHDFEFAWKRFIDPETASPAAFLANLIEGAEGFNSGEGTVDDVMVTALDDKTLEVTLTSPQSYFLNVITNPPFFPVHKETVEGNENWHAEASTIHSNGPFKLTQWDKDSQIIIEKNEHYWDTNQVKLDQVVWKMVNDSNTSYQMYTSGELHTSDVPADLSEQLFANGEVNVEDSSGTMFFRFNVTEEPFQNVNIRRAFSMAVDRQQIIDYVIKGQQRAATAFVSYGFTDAQGDDFREKGGDLISFNLEEAKQLLEQGMAEEGYTALPEITLSYNNTDINHRIAQALQEMLRQNLGVEVNLTSQEGAVFLAAQRALELQFSRSSFIPDFGDPINFLESFITGSSMNRTGWSHAEYDSLIAEAYQEADDARRFELLHRAESILFEESPIIPLYFYNTIYLQADDVKGIVRHPVGYLELKWADME
ncbi:peptide ABC transporter substrate-binding protein [Bacillus horti]|uniref:Dipeptide transport system substrate-binding protein n=1 Tax=Caldalkalibacillus horti TaxID=77523 RepID=A0ABT9VTF6_9BACI|nr:peptide ABC transporter substrate-binding protein [Bacillus horti]MDQ0164271.1 dipeptide transport system substrate-binding protein [Bacillus horti]